jgi:hypothetical protein
MYYRIVVVTDDGVELEFTAHSRYFAVLEMAKVAREGLLRELEGGNLLLIPPHRIQYIHATLRKVGE